MPDTDIIIIGGGAAGLMAARALGKAGKKIILLEARNRPGGRIHTLEDGPFTKPTEAGAEFIHGNLPVTIGLLKEARIGYHAIDGDLWRFANGLWKQEDDFMEGGDLLSARLHELHEDMTVAAFFEQHFASEQYTGLKESVSGYIEGYDAGDINRASAFALRNEWSDDAFDAQYRVTNGYGQMVRFLADSCRAAGCIIHLEAVAQHIHWRPGQVKVITAGNDTYTAQQVLITVPLGVLQAAPGSEGAITFSPALPEKMAAIHALGFGAIIKILLQFNTAFWKEPALHQRIGKDIRHMGWAFSTAPVPTWWTQLPDDSALLTGWLGGPRAYQLQHSDEKIILDQALSTLALFFSMSSEELQHKLVASQIVNWPAEPFTRGAYSYATCDTPAAVKIMTQPVENTLFFAGEALHDGPQMGTVEGALASGLQAAKEMANGE